MSQYPIPEDQKTAVNTDRELWRETEGDYYAPSLFVTQAGGIGIDVGGMVHVRPIRVWHSQAERIALLESENTRLREALEWRLITETDWPAVDAERRSLEVAAFNEDGSMKYLSGIGGREKCTAGYWTSMGYTHFRLINPLAHAALAEKGLTGQRENPDA